MGGSARSSAPHLHGDHRTESTCACAAPRPPPSTCLTAPDGPPALHTTKLGPAATATAPPPLTCIAASARIAGRRGPVGPPSGGITGMICGRARLGSMAPPPGTRAPLGGWLCSVDAEGQRQISGTGLIIYVLPAGKSNKI